MNPYIDMFNYSYIQQKAQQHHINQVIEVQKCAQKLREFFNDIDHIEPAYQQMANAEFCSIVLDYIRKHN